MKKFSVSVFALMMALSFISCGDDEDNDFDPDYEGSIISFSVSAGGDVTAYSWGENTSSFAVVTENALTLKAHKNNQTDAPYINIAINGDESSVWAATHTGVAVELELRLPNGSEYTGSATVTLTNAGSGFGGTVIGTFTASTVTGESGSISITAGVINLKRKVS